MRKNTKGFTLIELLAIIVILAIIALITTPIIMTVINDARENAAEDKAWGTIDAVRVAWTNAQTDEDPVGIPYTVVFVSSMPTSSTGNWGTNSAGAGYGKYYVNSRKVSASGDNPTKGWSTIREDGTIIVYDLKFGNYYCSSIDVDASTKEKTFNANKMVCSRKETDVTFTSAETSATNYVSEASSLKESS